METAKKAFSRGVLPAPPPQVCEEQHMHLQLNLGDCLLIPMPSMDEKV